MNLTQKLDRWAVTHHPRWIDLLRIALGIILFIKGFLFIRDTTTLVEILKHSRFEWVSFALAHYIAFAHLVGGIMITIGLMTRLAALVQLPILIGAILFFNTRSGFLL